MNVLLFLYCSCSIACVLAESLPWWLPHSGANQLQQTSITESENSKVVSAASPVEPQQITQRNDISPVSALYDREAALEKARAQKREAESEAIARLRPQKQAETSPRASCAQETTAKAKDAKKVSEQEENAETRDLCYCFLSRQPKEPRRN